MGRYGTDGYDEPDYRDAKWHTAPVPVADSPRPSTKHSKSEPTPRIAAVGKALRRDRKNDRPTGLTVVEAANVLGVDQLDVVYMRRHSQFPAARGRDDYGDPGWLVSDLERFKKRMDEARRAGEDVPECFYARTERRERARAEE